MSSGMLHLADTCSLLVRDTVGDLWAPLLQTLPPPNKLIMELWLLEDVWSPPQREAEPHLWCLRAWCAVCCAEYFVSQSLC